MCVRVFVIVVVSKYASIIFDVMYISENKREMMLFYLGLYHVCILKERLIVTTIYNKLQK